MGKGLAALTFDKEYQKKRREQLNKKPANLQEGLARSSKGLVMVNSSSQPKLFISIQIKMFFLSRRFSGSRRWGDRRFYETDKRSEKRWRWRVL